MGESERARRLASLLAGTVRLADLLPHFHQAAHEVAAGGGSVFLRLDARSGQLHLDSADGVDACDGSPWFGNDLGRQVVEQCWADGVPLILSDPRRADERLTFPAAVLAPVVAGQQRFGVWAVAAESGARAAACRDELGGLANLLAVALDRARLNCEAALHHDLRQLTAALPGAVSSSVHLHTSLTTFCERAAQLFSARAVSVWLHDRRARMLDRVATSAHDTVADVLRVAADASTTVGAAMRGVHGTLVPASDGGVIALVPLRGRRRALGTLQIDGMDASGVDLLDRAEEVARHVSSAIENVWLLEEVLRSRRELESTFNSLTDLVVVADAQLRVTQANRALALRVGRQPEVIASRPLADFFGREVMNWIERSGTRPHAFAPADESREIADEKLNGTFLFTLSALSGHANERIGTVIVARDVTTQARLEAERAELRSRLTQSEKLAALGQFVAGIAHELNNPLQGVLGHVELMLHEGGPENPFRHELRLVFREADRAAKIVHNLLVFAGSRRITRRRLNANNVVDKVLSLRATACAAAGIDVVKDLSPRLPRVAGDSLLLQQAILNIVLNAEQAMAGVHGSRRLEVRTRAVRPHRIEIEIADNGPGIHPDALPRVFEPFYTTKEVGQGTGLGLAIAYGVIQEHGGQLKAANRANGGAVFTLTLPAGFSEAVE